MTAKDKHFHKKIYWSCATGKFVNKFTGEESRSRPTTLAGPPAFTGTVNDWNRTLLFTIVDASNISQDANGTKSVVFSSYDRRTKLTAFYESLPAVSEIKIGEFALKYLETFEEFKKLSDYTGKLFAMDVKFDPMLSPNLIIVGEYGKNPILIELLDCEFIE